MKPRIPEVIRPPVTFHAYKDHITAVFEIGNSTIGLRFQSPEEMLIFFNSMMEKAVLVWPDNPWVKDYLSD